MSTSNGTIPNGHPRKEERGASRDIFRMSGMIAVFLTVPLPLLAFLICIILSMTNDFEETTFPTCTDTKAGKIPNFLPSISAAIGNTPQRYIWRILFALHVTPRYILAVMHYNYNQGFPVTNKRSWFKRLNMLACFLHCMEIVGLILVTFVSSSENYPVHEKGFMIFVGCATFYMVCVLILFRWARHDVAWTTKDIRSYRLKIFCFVSSIACTLLAMYFFGRHMQYCEPNVYSWFAIFEYLLVVSNMSFHGTWMLIDFSGSWIHVSVPVRPGQYMSLPSV